MAERRIGIIMHGVTGRMGTNQHLIRSILAIRAEGGVALADGTRVMPEPLLVGRDPAQARGARRSPTASPAGRSISMPRSPIRDYEIFFDAASTQLRAGLLQRAIAAGKHVYCEKPVAEKLEDALARLARRRGRRHPARRGPGQALAAGAAEAEDADRCRLLRPHPRRSRATSATGCSRATGRPRSARPGTTGRTRAAASSSTCSATGATCSTTCSARSERVFCLGRQPHPGARRRAAARRYVADADDAAYAIFELEGGIVAQINSSWCTRVRRTTSWSSRSTAPTARRSPA